MANRQAIKLFAVAALAASGASTAYAGGARAMPRGDEPIVERTHKDGTINLTIKNSIEQVPMQPRALKSLRPACGNTGGKSSYSSAPCTTAEKRTIAEQNAQMAEQNRIYEAEARRRAERYSAEQTKLLATAEAIIRAQPALAARVLIDGRPACGNTGSKMSPPAFCTLQARK